MKMQVQIAFDTEKESLEDLKKLAMAIQDLISEREKQLGVMPPATSHELRATSQQLQANSYQPQQFQQPQKPVPKEGKTAGGGRVIPYEDLSGMMDKIFSSNIPKRR